MRIGIHVSSQGRLDKTARKAVTLGANTFQIFCSSPRSWRARVIPPKEVELFLSVRDKFDLKPFVIHVNYLVNLASPKAEILEKSIESFRAELERALLLRADYLILHPGSSVGDEPNRAIERVAESIARAAKGLKLGTLRILLEQTAGQGTALGSRFEELALLRELTEQKLEHPVGYCLDTAHLLAAGYELASPEGFRRTMKQVEAVLGFERVLVIHANDSKAPLGSRLDRHEHIGQGYIGIEGFRRLMNHPQLRSRPFILETPFESDEQDRQNLETLKKLCRKKSTTTSRLS